MKNTNRFSPSFLRTACVTPVIALCLMLTALSAVVETPVIGAESKLPKDPRQDYARYVRFRPAHRQEVTLNPPRFSWPFLPGIVFEKGSVSSDARFTLQISKTKDFKKPFVTVNDTPCNFYNFLPELKGSRKWYWRVGYGSEGKKKKWSDTRSFTIAKDAVVWDRSKFDHVLDSLESHPRILFNAGNKAAVLDIRNTDGYSEQLYRGIISQADNAITSRQYRNFPKTDDKPGNYMSVSHPLVFVGFAYLLTGDEKYAGFKERILTIASWPKGGESSPEGKGHRLKWNTHMTEYMGFLYDWFYDEWTPRERKQLRESLEWRLDWTLNDFAWRVEGGRKVSSRNIGSLCSSHAYQNILAIVPGALAICDESEVARQALEIALHYIIGISNGHGEDEAWMDGPGYGNGKMKWLTNASCSLQATLPELDLGKNEAYSAYADFFARITPIGAEHSSFGNRGFNERDWASSRIHNFRRVAMLCDNPQAMQNWIDTLKRFEDLGKNASYSQSPYIDYVLPFYAKTPSPSVESNPVGIFPVEGWISASSAPPSDYQAQKDAVSMVFVCRPRGGNGHSFRSENAFDIHAYGKTVAAGGGSTSNLSDFANDTMSHNTVLVNGREQEAARDPQTKTCGRIIAFEQGANFTYWAGDATPAYGEKTGLGKFVRHVVFVNNEFFVIYDELEMLPGQKPATFQWLYHVPACRDFSFEEDAFALDYAVGKTRVYLQHFANPKNLDLQRLHAADGMINPVTGKDYTETSKRQSGKVAKKKMYGQGGAKVPATPDIDHIWISNKTPKRSTNFLAAIVPYREGESAPKLTRINNAAISVSFRGKETSISFDASSPGNITVDVAAISGTGS